MVTKIFTIYNSWSNTTISRNQQWWFFRSREISSNFVMFLNLFAQDRRRSLASCIMGMLIQVVFGISILHSKPLIVGLCLPCDQITDQRDLQFSYLSLCFMYWCNTNSMAFVTCGSMKLLSLLSKKTLLRSIFLFLSQVFSASKLFLSQFVCPPLQNVLYFCVEHLQKKLA